MISISRNMYLDKVDDLVNKYNNTYHSTTKMRLVDVNSITYIDFDNKNNKENPKFKGGDHVRISKCKNIFTKDDVPNWSKKFFAITKYKNTILWTYVISDPNGEEVVGRFYIKELIKNK